MEFLCVRVCLCGCMRERRCIFFGFIEFVFDRGGGLGVYGGTSMGSIRYT